MLVRRIIEQRIAEALAQAQRTGALPAVDIPNAPVERPAEPGARGLRVEPPSASRQAAAHEPVGHRGVRRGPRRGGRRDRERPRGPSRLRQRRLEPGMAPGPGGGDTGGRRGVRQRRRWGGADGPGRVRERQPDWACTRRPRARGRTRQRPRRVACGRRLRRQPRVLRQRHRHADGAVLRVGVRPVRRSAWPRRRTPPRGRLPRRVPGGPGPSACRGFRRPVPDDGAGRRGAGARRRGHRTV